MANSVNISGLKELALALAERHAGVLAAVGEELLQEYFELALRASLPDDPGALKAYLGLAEQPVTQELVRKIVREELAAHG